MMVLNTLWEWRVMVTSSPTWDPGPHLLCPHLVLYQWRNIWRWPFSCPDPPGSRSCSWSGSPAESAYPAAGRPLTGQRSVKVQEDSGHTVRVRQVKDFTLKMTLMLSPLGSRFWKDSLRGTALELKKEHNYKTERESWVRSAWTQHNTHTHTPGGASVRWCHLKKHPEQEWRTFPVVCDVTNFTITNPNPNPNCCFLFNRVTQTGRTSC